MEEALSELWGVTLMTVASAGASITVSRACVNRFLKLLDHGQTGSKQSQLTQTGVGVEKLDLSKLVEKTLP